MKKILLFNIILCLIFFLTDIGEYCIYHNLDILPLGARAALGTYGAAFLALTVLCAAGAIICLAIEGILKKNMCHLAAAMFFSACIILYLFAAKTNSFFMHCISVIASAGLG